MKTKNLHFEIYNTSNLVNATEKITIDTATDIFEFTIWKRIVFNRKKWKKVYSFWGFSGFALNLLKNLNNWLEYYNEKN